MSSERPRTARTPENAQLVRAAVERSPRRSARKHSVALRISDRSLRRIMHQDLSLKPYKIILVQEITPQDYDVDRCQDMVNEIPTDSTFWSSDEAHFHLNGTVNKQNFRNWASTNPRELHEKPLHSPKVTVWCDISKFGVIGHYFFEENGHTVTVTAERYVSMLQFF